MRTVDIRQALLLLLSAGVPCVDSSRKHNNLFHESAIRGDNATLAWLISMATGEGRSPGELLQRINEKDDKEQFPLFLAALHGSSEVALTLLDNNADPKLAAKHGVTPLMAAAAGTLWSTNQTAIVDMLIFAGAEVNARATKQRFTALMLAAFIGCPARVKLLLEAGANTADQDVDGYTALEYAGARDYGLGPFWPIPLNEPSEEFKRVRNRTAVELFLLRKRNDDLDEIMLDSLEPIERDAYDTLFASLDAEEQARVDGGEDLGKILEEARQKAAEQKAEQEKQFAYAAKMRVRALARARRPGGPYGNDDDETIVGADEDESLVTESGDKDEL